MSFRFKKVFQFVHTYLNFRRAQNLRTLGFCPVLIPEGDFFLHCWFRDKKSSNTLIFIHGLLDSSAGFRRLAKYLLNEDCNLLLLDLPGFGWSQYPKWPYAYSIDGFAKIWLKSLRKYGLLKEKNFLLGHSLGGLVAQHMVLLEKESSFEGLILLAPGNSPHPERDKMRDLLLPKNPDQVDSLWDHLFFDKKNSPNWFLKKYILWLCAGYPYKALEEDTLLREQEVFLGQKIRKYKNKVLLIAGSNDEIVTSKQIKSLSGFLKNVETKFLPCTKHALHWESAHDLAPLIKKFLCS